MAEENADLQWSDHVSRAAPEEYDMPHRTSSAVVHAMNEARQKPKRISVEDLVPLPVRQHYEAFWKEEWAGLVEVEKRHLAEQARWDSLWWWQKVRETLWPTT